MHTQKATKITLLIQVVGTIKMAITPPIAAAKQENMVALLMRSFDAS